MFLQIFIVIHIHMVIDLIRQYTCFVESLHDKSISLKLFISVLIIL